MNTEDRVRASFRPFYHCASCTAICESIDEMEDHWISMHGIPKEILKQHLEGIK